MLSLLYILLTFSSVSFPTSPVDVSARQVARRTLLQNGGPPSSSCPLDFSILHQLAQGVPPPKVDTETLCGYVRQGIQIVQSQFLRDNNSFLPPLDSAESCWAVYQTVVQQFIPGFDARSSCGFQTSWIAQGCMNISTRAQFESVVNASVLRAVVSACNSTLDGSACNACSSTLGNLYSSSLTGISVGNVSDCRAYASIYGAAINPGGPIDGATVSCLFSLNFPTTKSSKNNRKIIILICSSVICSAVVLAMGLIWFRVKKKRNARKELQSESSFAISRFDSLRSTTLFRFTFDEIKEATNNFSVSNVIGNGGYGNVYRGVLPDGSEVAFKRFKNFTAAGAADFTHEVEVIASVRHVNLVALRGYCTLTTQHEGHQRIIVCDLMKNGSLYDHLFRSTGKKLSWPVRQNIASGTAKGLAYLHYGVRPAIIHRDIKANNILLDENFEPKVADFGLARFTPEGMTHLSTGVAGTMGYVAPEYALYGQLTERSDVYSFGIVVLELLSGKKALVANNNDEQPTLLSDWAWSLVREGRTLEVIDGTMPDRGNFEVMEKYVLIAVLCSHPQLYARPTMDQVVKMLDMDVPVPSIPERPVPLISDINDLEISESTSGSSYLSATSASQSQGYSADSFS